MGSSNADGKRRQDRDTPDMTGSADPPHPSGGDSASDQTEQDQIRWDEIWMKGYMVGLSTGMVVGGWILLVRKKLSWVFKNEELR